MDCPCKEGLPVTNLEEGCENKYASPYIGEPFGENRVGGKWLIGAGLHIPRIEQLVDEHCQKLLEAYIQTHGR
jgi:hypothetical protein